MDCDSAREAISARIDGEDPGPPGDGVDKHLTDCAACRAWQQRAHAVTRRARLGGAFLDHDLASQVLSAVPVPGARRWQRLAPRFALIMLALGQLTIALPMLFGHDHDAGVHAAHELGSFNLALAIAFGIGALRPALSAGLAWPCGISAVGLVTTAIADLIGGQAIGADEAQHLVALAGAALLVWQSRTAGARIAGPAAAVPAAEDLGRPARSSLEVVIWAGAAPEPPRGGDAARGESVA
ncbi:MAG TPA: zf-HC2 domain-containing protein [Trebonia sp.]|jgi:predicted anti-sigma-YlaC factor YlaD